MLCSGQNTNETSGQDRSFGVKRSGSGPSSATLTPSLKKYFLNTCVPASVMGGETKCLKNEQALLHRESREINTPNLRRDERVLAPPHPELWRGSRVTRVDHLLAIGGCSSKGCRPSPVWRGRVGRTDTGKACPRRGHPSPCGFPSAADTRCGLRQSPAYRAGLQSSRLSLATETPKPHETRVPQPQALE